VQPDINGSKRRRTPGVRFTPPPTDASGNRLCRNCHGPMPANRPRLHNCCSACSEEWMAKTSPNFMRYLVWKRDHAVCAICHQDSVAGRLHRNGSPWTNRSRGTGDFWQADHIVPVVEGGGECSLANFRTLCTACHRAETAELARRRAEARSKQMRDVSS
jgi:5-methylcytosine-specific restriction endonuclease McrA